MEMVYDVTAGRFGTFYVNPEKGDGLNPQDTASLTGNTTKYPENTPLMQFTGLKDKNGKEIYEGDINREEFSVNDEEGIDERIYFLCDWFPQTCSFVWMTLGDTMTDWDNETEEEYPTSLQKNESQKYVVVGNIYENENLFQ